MTLRSRLTEAEAAVVFGVELHGHDDVHMTFVSLGVRGERLSDADKTEVVVPIPQLDQHIVSARQNVGERFVDIDSTNVVVMRLPFFHLKLMTENSDYFFSCVVVVDTDFQVVASKDDPLLSRDELAAANREDIPAQSDCEFPSFRGRKRSLFPRTCTTEPRARRDGSQCILHGRSFAARTTILSPDTPYTCTWISMF